MNDGLTPELEVKLRTRGAPGNVSSITDQNLEALLSEIDELRATVLVLYREKQELRAELRRERVQ